MSSTTAKASVEDAKKLAAKGAIRATVLGREAIVQASAWDPVTPSAEHPPYSITAR